LKTELFDYPLPDQLIATRPLERRSDARLLVLEAGRISHRMVREFPQLVPEGALVVLNDTRVRRARVLASRADSGGRVELLLLRPVELVAEGELWEALGRANKPLRPGTRIHGEPEFAAEVVAVAADGLLRVRLNVKGGVESWLGQHGHVPIPPYLRRADEALDTERYQTVFAKTLGSVAAPTAGLHLDLPMLEQLAARGVATTTLTLDIGLGTFRPVSADDLDRHPMHAETISVGAETVAAVAAARKRHAPVIALGTTVVRALEAAADPAAPGQVRPFFGETRLLIQPGYVFSVVDGLFTNFHQPKSTLLALVCAFAGREAVLAAYAAAMAHEYRFLSYGDAMWIPRRA
jgi:S-adenosylmethionine:tRNA ribosyltransferase-isomerase